jgi:hypothetical protein
MRTGFSIGDRGLGASGDTHPHWMMAHAEVGSYLVVGASAIGKLHLAHRSPRDDAFAVRSIGPWLAVAVADGVGTRPLSRFGATYVVESLTALLLRKLPAATAPESEPFASGASSSEDAAVLKDVVPPPAMEQLIFNPPLVRYNDDASEASPGDAASMQFHQAATMGWYLSLPGNSQGSAPQPVAPDSSSPAPSVSQEAALLDAMEQAFDKTYLGLKQHASSLSVEMADLSCTALAFLLNVETGYGVVGQIGDGALLGLSTQLKVEELVKAPDAGDPQSTYTINRPNFKKYLAISPIAPSAEKDFTAFYVMTDGVSGDLLYAQHSALDEWAKSINAALQTTRNPSIAAAQLLNWLSSYEVKGSWDDRTLVIIMQRERNDGNSHPVTGEPEPARPTDDH